MHFSSICSGGRDEFLPCRREKELSKLMKTDDPLFRGNVGRARSRVAFMQKELNLTAEVRLA